MTKDELINWLTKDLADVPGNTPIVLAKDGEGNGFSPLSQIDETMYDATSTWSGEIHPTDEQIAASDYYDDEDEAPESAVPALVLWPVN